MRKTIPRAVSFEVPLGPIEGSKLHDADAEAVIKFAEEEKRAEEEQFAMGKHDVRPEAVAPLEVTAETLHVEAEGDAPMVPSAVNPGGAASSSTGAIDPGLMVPVTPPRDGDSPIPAATRPMEGEVEEVQKRARTEDAKKLRIQRLQAEYEQRLSAVKVAYKEYFTMDDYSNELDLDENVEGEQDDWAGKNDIQLSGVPEQLWFDFPVDAVPTEPPEQ